MGTSKFDISDYLNNNEMIAEYLKEVLKEGDNAQIIAAIGYIEKAVQEGIDSGVALNFNPDKHLQELKVQKKNFSN